MSVVLRASGLACLLVGLALASYAYLGPGLQQQDMISRYEASTNKDAFDRSYPGWRESLNKRGETERIASELYGLVVAVVGVGLVISGGRPATKAEHGPA